MTHTLHRVGSRESLQGDWVFLCMPSKDINHEQSGPKLRRFLELCLKNNCVTLGDCRKGNEYHQLSRENMLNNVEDRAVVTATFNNKDAVIAMIEDLKQADLGLSIVISGLVDEVGECCAQTGLKPHTVEHSLGRWGKTEKLPPQAILEIATMCGHSMIAVNFINEMIEKVKKGKTTAPAAAAELFKPCMCGIFNTDRAAKLIAEMAKR
ncbi:hypothetical protein [Sporomusa termitida]|uniref:Uncharacterized protein n=1 Tax=Sporomusa termitida TaxID=2377 RepID=A0A517DNF1_9FIRM|nr:hypothetical protein [Sporomusa termitida]QDR78890.1 hypothetical protein SPTER_01400 [Sporomusa termitida]